MRFGLKRQIEKQESSANAVAGSNPASSSKKTENQVKLVFLKNEGEQPVDRMGTNCYGFDFKEDDLGLDKLRTLYYRKPNLLARVRLMVIHTM